MVDFQRPLSEDAKNEIVGSMSIVGISPIGGGRSFGVEIAQYGSSYELRINQEVLDWAVSVSRRAEQDVTVLLSYVTSMAGSLAQRLGWSGCDLEKALSELRDTLRKSGVFPQEFFEEPATQPPFAGGVALPRGMRGKTAGQLRRERP